MGLVWSSVVGDRIMAVVLKDIFTLKGDWMPPLIDGVWLSFIYLRVWNYGYDIPFA